MAAVAAFRDPQGFPGDISRSTVDRARLQMLWHCYQNTQFDDLTVWQSYREKFQLYRNIRPIYNPTRRLVNFYVDHVYPGALSEDASQLPDGVQLAIPLSDDTDENLKIAIAQFWQWSNWQSENKKMVLFGGSTGSCLVEVVDNVEKGKVSAVVRWPGRLADKAKDESPSLVLDSSGNVKFYALEYDALDATGKTVKYRKEVSQESFRYYKDDTLDEEVENFYGFVPAVWCKHLDEGDDFGSPAIAGSLGKIDELNGLVSHDHDNVDILIDSPGIITTSGNIGNIASDSANLKTSRADEYSALSAAKEKPTKRLLLKGPEGTQWVPLTGNLDPDKVVPLIDRLLTEIEHDFPELSMYQKLREMSEVTGPGAARLMGDVGKRVLRVSSNYDQQSIKLFQMACAIGGFRFREGKEGWREKTDQRKKFAPFSLDSYAKGELDMAIMPRPLIPMTEADMVDIEGKRLDNAGKAKDIFSQDKVLEVAGIADEEERKQIIADREQASQNQNNNALGDLARRAALGGPAGVRGLLAP
ncbi:MAG TPA: hypothetical protein VFX97_16800 [Pyrinomonadaceae bacterium]|nr:hypothetical protein [Pyrinomonadaceae bacterium]